MAFKTLLKFYEVLAYHCKDNVITVYIVKKLDCFREALLQHLLYPKSAINYSRRHYTENMNVVKALIFVVYKHEAWIVIDYNY